jgi:hypothetical protein
MKRGQVTVFIIVGIVILFIFGVFFGINSILTKGKVTNVQDTSSLSTSGKAFIESCIERTGEEAILFVSEQGGYYDLPELHDEDLLVPFYLHEGENKLLTKNELELQLSFYMDNQLSYCLQNFVHFEEQGYNVEQMGVVTDTSISNDSVIFDVALPVTFQQGEAEVNMDSFSVLVPARLGLVYSTIDEFMKLEEEDASLLCVSCLFEVLSDDNMRAETTYVDDEVVMFTIIDEGRSVNDEPIEYNFLNWYNFTDIYSEEDNINEEEVLSDEE